MKRYLRSPREIAFRLRQEIANFILYLFPPTPALSPPSPFPLPDPAAVAAALRSTPYADSIASLAASILDGHFPLLGTHIDIPTPIQWRRDPVHGHELPPGYFRRIPYLDFSRAGDHKFLWELNRHHHLVLLAQAWRLDPRPDYLDAIAAQLASWHEQNPFQRGMNWTSALEVAFRALNWIWIWHLCGAALPPATRAALLTGLYQHGCHLEYNLSIYFSPNTHVLGEAIVLHALGALFPDWPRANRWRRIGAAETARQTALQILPSGAHFELSSYYHLYAFDLLLFHNLLCSSASPPLAAMARYLHALNLPGGSLPLIGDDDGGRLFHPYGERRRFARASLAAAAVHLSDPVFPCDPADLPEIAAWWLGPRVFSHSAPGIPPQPVVFPDSGLVRLGDGVHHTVLFDAGGFGPFRAGHSHSDALQILLWTAGEEVLADSGTCTYIADPILRDYFRSSAAHNTIRIDGHDQAVPAGPFAWNGRPEVSLIAASDDSAEAICRAHGYTHRRRIHLDSDALVIDDIVEGPSGAVPLIEQFWHLGTAAAAARFRFCDGQTPVAEEGGEFSRRSDALGQCRSAPVAVRRARGPLPCHWRTIIRLG
ncbi:MAG: heparinase II/III family protein [Bryobacterales bacterium]|nr:heparinase II/III family protein [Bryobacterales bacterium]